MAGILQLRSLFFLPHDSCMHKYVCLVDHHSNFDSSCFPLQMKDLHSEQCQYTSNILCDLIVQGDQEALQVVAAAAEEGIAGTYLYIPFSFWPPKRLPTEAFLRMKVHSLRLPCYFTGFSFDSLLLSRSWPWKASKLWSSEGPRCTNPRVQHGEMDPTYYGESIQPLRVWACLARGSDTIHNHRSKLLHLHL